MSNPIRDLLSGLSLASLLLIAATVTALGSVRISSFPICSLSVFSSLRISAADVVLVSSLMHLAEKRMLDFSTD